MAPPPAPRSGPLKRRRGALRLLSLMFGFGVVAITNYVVWVAFTDEGDNQRKLLLEGMDLSLPTLPSFPKVEAKDKSKNDGRTCVLMEQPEIEFMDMYAGAWLMSRNRFCDPASTQLEKITNLEAATFVTFFDHHFKEVRMTKDWLDFSVEHLSKWWVAAGFWQDAVDTLHERTLHTILDKYNRHSQKLNPASSFFQSTISVIPFMSWQSKNPDLQGRARKMSVAVLAATLETLVRAGIPRVIVAVIDDGDLQISKESVDLLAAAQHISGDETATDPNMMQVTTIKVALETPNFNPFLLPKVALMGLRFAFTGNGGDGSKSAQELQKERYRWLGPDLDRWKYVYFTEADTILNFRPSALPTLEAAMNSENALIMPHRIVAVPHQSDLEGLRRPFRYIPAEGPFANVTELDMNKGDACCDAGNEHPGRPPAIPTCGNFWYLCDFGLKYEPKNGMSRRHQRLEPYGVMRLTAGIGLTVGSASESARRCIPRKQGTCD